MKFTPKPESAADLYESLERIVALEYSHKSSFKCFVKAVEIARGALKRAKGGEQTPSQRFAEWAQEGPRLAKAAGVHVGITVTAEGAILPSSEG